MPGEPFPEVRAAIANATTGADTIISLSKGQDDWGYFYPAWAWGFTSLYDSDHNIYNIAPQAGDQVILDQASNIGKLGFTVEQAAASTPLPTRWEQALRPGVQAMASPTWGDAGAGGTLPVTFTAIYDGAYLDGAALAGKVHVDFGDGTYTDVTGDKRTRFVHDYGPGTYTVQLSAQDTNGNPATWQLVVRVYGPLRPVIVATQAGAEHAGRSTESCAAATTPAGLPLELPGRHDRRGAARHPYVPAGHKPSRDAHGRRRRR